MRTRHLAGPGVLLLAGTLSGCLAYDQRGHVDGEGSEQLSRQGETVANTVVEVAKAIFQQKRRPEPRRPTVKVRPPVRVPVQMPTPPTPPTPQPRVEPPAPPAPPVPVAGVSLAPGRPLRGRVGFENRREVVYLLVVPGDGYVWITVRNRMLPRAELACVGPVKIQKAAGGDPLCYLPHRRSWIRPGQEGATREPFVLRRGEQLLIHVPRLVDGHGQAHNAEFEIEARFKPMESA